MRQQHLVNILKDPDEFGLKVNIANYPELAAVFNGITITDFEKPSYFTRKPALMQIFRIQFLIFR